MKKWLLAGIVVTLSACSNTETSETVATANKVQAQVEAQNESVEQGGNIESGQEVASVEPKKKVKCRYEKTIGSNRKRKVCKSVDYENKQRDAAWEYMMRSQGRVQSQNN